jgi:hypothetical protein
MYRKFLATLVALMIVGGAVFAEEIMGVFVKYDEGKVTIKVDDKEKSYDVDKDAKVKFKDKEFALTDSLKRYKEGAKVTLTVEGGKVVKAKQERKKKE